MRVILADLGHNRVTKSSDIYPLNVANLAMYAGKYLPEPGLKFEIYREPEDFIAALDAGRPDAVGFSSYAWNHRLAMQMAERTKAMYPDTLTVMGGPNYPLTLEEAESYMRTLNPIDVAVRGPTYEGEVAFLNIMRRYHEVGGRLAGIFEEAVPGNHWVDPNTGDFVVGSELSRIMDLDDIPSPYTSGLLDPYFDTGYFPMMQLARGCPFTCQFCNSSVRGNSKVYAHSLENIKADLDYVAQRVKPELALCLADDNFGMYDLDAEVADYVADLQDRYGWPQYIRTTTGKNRHDKIIKVMRKIRGVLPMTAAVQSTNPQVLKNVKRSNIKLEAYTKIQEEVLAQGMQAYGELILCMPGETLESFMTSVDSLLDTGVKRVSAHQLMLLHGAPLNNPDQREQWQFDTRFRVVARNIGNYTGEPIVETEEIVVDTPDFPFADYLHARIFHLLLTVYFYEGNFEEAFALAKQHGVKPFDLVVKLQQLLDEAPTSVKQFVEDFVRESKEELFETEEECIAFANENYDALIGGELGGNLLSKYSMIGRFYATDGALEFLQLGIAHAIRDNMEDDSEGQLEAVISYLQSVMLHAPLKDALKREPEWTSTYDVEAWRLAKFESPLSDHRLAQPAVYRGEMEPDRAAKIATRVDTFGEHPSGLGKFTRTMFSHDLRRSVVKD